MVLRTLVTKLREAKIVSSQTPIRVFTSKFNGRIDYKANNKSSELTEFERQYDKLLLLDTDGILYD